MKTALVALIAVLLSACDSTPKPVSPRYESDQKLRAERFDACMKQLPIGPANVKYNDWAEVVSECESAAYWQSRRCVANCPVFKDSPQEASDG